MGSLLYCTLPLPWQPIPSPHSASTPKIHHALTEKTPPGGTPGGTGTISIAPVCG